MFTKFNFHLLFGSRAGEGSRVTWKWEPLTSLLHVFVAQEQGGVQVSVVLGVLLSYRLVLKMSNFPEKIVSKGDDPWCHASQAESDFCLASLRILNFREMIRSASDEQRPSRHDEIFFTSKLRNIGLVQKWDPQKWLHFFFLIVGYLVPPCQNSFHSMHA